MCRPERHSTALTDCAGACGEQGFVPHVRCGPVRGAIFAVAQLRGCVERRRGCRLVPRGIVATIRSPHPRQLPAEWRCTHIPACGCCGSHIEPSATPTRRRRPLALDHRGHRMVRGRAVLDRGAQKKPPMTPVWGRTSPRVGTKMGPPPERGPQSLGSFAQLG